MAAWSRATAPLREFIDISPELRQARLDAVAEKIYRDKYMMDDTYFEFTQASCYATMLLNLGLCGSCPGLSEFLRKTNLNSGAGVVESISLILCGVEENLRDGFFEAIPDQTWAENFTGEIALSATHVMHQAFTLAKH